MMASSPYPPPHQFAPFVDQQQQPEKQQGKSNQFISSNRYDSQETFPYDIISSTLSIFVGK